MHCCSRHNTGEKSSDFGHIRTTQILSASPIPDRDDQNIVSGGGIEYLQPGPVFIDRVSVGNLQVLTALGFPDPPHHTRFVLLLEGQLCSLLVHQNSRLIRRYDDTVAII